MLILLDTAVLVLNVYLKASPRVTSFKGEKMQGYSVAYQSVRPRDQIFSPPTEDWQPGNVILTKTNGIDKRIVPQISHILA